MDYEQSVAEPGEVVELTSYIDDIGKLRSEGQLKPLWIVTGSFVHPSILCARLIRYPANYMHTTLPESICIWGYQYTRKNSKKGRFGSYGMNLETFVERHEGRVRYFQDKESAFAFLGKLVAHPGGRDY